MLGWLGSTGAEKVQTKSRPLKTKTRVLQICEHREACLGLGCLGGKRAPDRARVGSVLSIRTFFAKIARRRVCFVRRFGNLM